jgi:hypothetical protein
MGNKNWFIFEILITFAFIFTPIIAFAQWPITADPSLAQNGLDDRSDGKSNHTLRSTNGTLHLYNPP